jgi:hypothetical protein
MCKLFYGVNQREAQGKIGEVGPHHGIFAVSLILRLL